MDQSTNYITIEKKKELEAELKELEGPKRREILESLEYAKSLGDLSENAEYHQARENQGQLEARIAKVKQILQSSEIASVRHGENISIGSEVVVQKEGSKDTKTYIMVGSEEADMACGKISNQSPVGQAIYGKKKGDSASFETPNGKVNYKIIEVS